MPSLLKKAFTFDEDLKKIKSKRQDIDWYPYGTLGNFQHLNDLLGADALEDLPKLAGGRPMVDIGTADGDTVFFLESLGYTADAVDYPPTNYNGCRGFRALRDARASRARLHEIDLDAHFELPDEHYGLAFFLGILYHLKNPFGALESLARLSDYALVSTRIARYNIANARIGESGLNPRRFEISAIPVAYLVAPDESNNDATNFWMFSESGLRRIFERSGWEVIAWTSVGDIIESDPASAAHDERAFCLLRSRHRRHDVPWPVR